MTPSSEAPAKTIPPARDRLQSKALVLLFTAALLLSFPYKALEHPDTWLWLVLGVSLTFALLVRLLRAATTGGALAGGVICFCITFLTGISDNGWGTSTEVGFLRSGLVPLLALFVITFTATRLGKPRKEAAGLAESRRGRSAAQVVANLGLAALLAHKPGGDVPRVVWSVMLLAALAESTADTVASEVGQAFGGMPRLFPSMRKVPAGTDGAMSVAGTLAGAVASAFLMLVSYFFVPTFSLLAIAWLGGLAGLFFDTILGATVERKGWLGNDLVNFSSTLFAALLVFALMRM